MMSVNWLIDGHNLIPNVPGLSLASADDEMQLIAWLQVFCRMQRTKVEVYFDLSLAGYSGSRTFGMVKAHFIQQGRSADDAIAARLRHLGKSASTWTVVTSDRRVQAEAKSVHAKVVSSADFSARLIQSQQQEQAKAKEMDKPLQEEEIAGWLELFRKKSC
jgi:predicted RNA-binding protein with PIN domain